MEAAFALVRPALVVHAAFARDEGAIVEATRHVVEAAATASASVVFISSEAVFAGDGRARPESAPPDPVWDYGRWKQTAEDLVSAADESAAVVRLPLIISVDPEDHIIRGIRAAIERNEQSVWFSDELRQPACADDLARAIWQISTIPAVERAGPWHLPGPERLSRVEIAERAAEVASLDGSSILAIPSPSDAQRPRDLYLTGERAQDEIGWSPRPIYAPAP